MEAKKETIADIVANLRGLCADGDTVVEGRTITRCNFVARDAVEAFAGLIEKAWKDERRLLVIDAENAKEARNKLGVRLNLEFAERCRECKAKVGNAGKLRETVEGLLEWNKKYSVAYAVPVAPVPERAEDVQAARDRAMDAARAALEAPARNCDVGTPKEQAVRKGEYCLRHAPFPDSTCDDCPLRNYNIAQPERPEGYSCDLAWGQLPYAPVMQGDGEGGE
jgi:hypothetical protein